LQSKQSKLKSCLTAIQKILSLHKHKEVTTLIFVEMRESHSFSFLRQTILSLCYGYQRILDAPESIFAVTLVM